MYGERELWVATGCLVRVFSRLEAIRRLPDGLRASVGSAVELQDGTDSNERTTNRSWFPFLNCPSTICADLRVAGSTPARSAYNYPCPAWSTSRTGHQGTSAPHPWGGSPDVLENGESGCDPRGSFRGAGTPTCRTPLRRWGIACGRYAPPPAVRTWSPPAPCATSAGKPRTSAARATAIHTPRKPIGSHEPVCWQGIRDASAQATDQTDAAGTTDYAAPPAP